MSKRRKWIKEEEGYLISIAKELTSNAQLHFWASSFWHLQRSEECRNKFYKYRHVQLYINFLLVVIGSFLQIPFFQSWSGYFGIVIAAAGGLSALIQAIISLHQYYENWKRNRMTLENLKSLARMYLSGCEPFDLPDETANEKLFLSELDSILKSEVNKWEQMRQSKYEEKSSLSNNEKSEG